MAIVGIEKERERERDRDGFSSDLYSLFTEYKQSRTQTETLISVKYEDSDARQQ